MLALFGCTKIILVGYDMQISGGMHWHGRHDKPLNNPTPENVERWRRVMDEAAESLDVLGVKIINCSPASALTNYRKMSFESALKEFKSDAATSPGRSAAEGRKGEAGIAKAV
jgi:hypothetical protein